MVQVTLLGTCRSCATCRPARSLVLWPAGELLLRMAVWIVALGSLSGAARGATPYAVLAGLSCVLWWYPDAHGASLCAGPAQLRTCKKSGPMACSRRELLLRMADWFVALGSLSGRCPGAAPYAVLAGLSCVLWWYPVSRLYASHVESQGASLMQASSLTRTVRRSAREA